MTAFIKTRWAGLLVAVLVMVLDFYSKQWVLENLWVDGGMRVIPGFFNLVVAFNPGVAFSQLQFAPEVMRWVLTAFAVIVSVGLLWWMGVEKSKFHRVGCGLVIGGALGNALDRIVHGAVVDFLDFYYNGVHWPAFNLADSAICVGVALLLLSSFFTPGGER